MVQKLDDLRLVAFHGILECALRVELVRIRHHNGMNAVCVATQVPILYGLQSQSIGNKCTLL
jgi:hypothetical protein